MTTTLDRKRRTSEALYLDPDCMGRGFGRRLIQQVQADMADAGFLEATLWVLDTNVRARSFYESCGWIADGARKVEERPAGLLFEVRYRQSLREDPLGSAKSPS